MAAASETRGTGEYPFGGKHFSFEDKGLSFALAELRASLAPKTRPGQGRVWDYRLSIPTCPWRAFRWQPRMRWRLTITVPHQPPSAISWPW